METYSIIHKQDFKYSRPIGSAIRASSRFNAIFRLQMVHGKYIKILNVRQIIDRPKFEDRGSI